MKKALALVLALVLALSMGVSAFALDLVEVVLKPATPASAEIIDITEYQLGTDADYGTKYLVGPKGGVYYITLDGSKEFKNIELSATGMVTAKVLDYDPESYTGADTEYVVKYEDAAVVLDETNAKDVLALATANGDYVSLTFGGMVTIDLGEASTYKQFAKALAEGKTIEEAAATLGIALPLTDVELNTADTSYKFAKALAKALNNQYQTSKFEVANVNEENVYVIELTVEENYTSSYKLGSVKVSAEEVLYEDAKGRDVTRPVANTISIVSDVAIFEYEMVKWAGKTGNSLVVNSDKGYSAFLTDGKYADKYGEYDEFELRYDDATVISTTAFRALRENEYGIVVETPHMEVAIEEIGAQRGVNFAYMVADDEWELGTDIVRVYDKDLVKKYGMDESFFDHIEFGFLG
ncbi:MAG: hypothetical protein IKJ57_03585, partial [Oscillospiraceae bacterium]|nr:hypothetical protein [Oscillospiraceae bacterium]